MPTLEKVAPLFRILSHPLRLRILDFLETMQNPQRVTEIVEVCGETHQAIVSQQLKIMREHGILIADRRGNCVYYSIANRDILPFLDTVREYAPTHLPGAHFHLLGAPPHLSEAPIHLSNAQTPLSKGKTMR